MLFERIIQSESVYMSVRLLIRLHVQEDLVSKTPLSYFLFFCINVLYVRYIIIMFMLGVKQLLFLSIVSILELKI